MNGGSILVRAHREIYLAFLAILLITGLYIGIAHRLSLPASSGLFGHGIGILGFLLMLATETLYSIRKRARSARWGRMRTWLQFHIFTGIVGPYLVLLHSAFEFRGLAGIVTLMMGIVVLSGFIGRYIYTSVPHTPEGVMVALDELERELTQTDEEIKNRFPVDTRGVLSEFQTPPKQYDVLFGRVLLRWRANMAWRKRLHQADEETRQRMLQIDALRKRRNDLVLQIRSAAVARRILAVWHSIHIPLGVSLFVAAFVHIGAALYYATLAR
jgi:hypothetical protein